VVSNPLGSVTSAPVVLTVIDPVIGHPAGQRTESCGDDCDCSTSGINGTAPTYQWLKDNSPQRARPIHVTASVDIGCGCGTYAFR